MIRGIYIIESENALSAEEVKDALEQHRGEPVKVEYKGIEKE